MNLAAMQAELTARGFDYLSPTRQTTYINAARAEFDRMYLWPWREKLVTGTAPLTVADLGTISAVVNNSNASYPLAKADYRTLLDSFADLSVSGTPSFYYIAWPSGSPQVTTYPTNANTIGVQYWRVTPDLVNGTDTPVSPSECHYTILDLAVRRAYRDADDHGNAGALQGEIDQAIQQFLVAYPPGIQDGPDAYVGVSGASEDW